MITAHGGASRVSKNEQTGIIKCVKRVLSEPIGDVFTFMSPRHKGHDFLIGMKLSTIKLKAILGLSRWDNCLILHSESVLDFIDKLKGTLSL